MNMRPLAVRGDWELYWELYWPLLGLGENNLGEVESSIESSIESDGCQASLGQAQA